MNDIEKHERSLFLHCLDLDPQQISEYLAEACRQNPEVQCRVEALLAANTRGSDLFDQADQQTALLETPDDQIAKHIGPYKLLQVIGEGGMGTVYMAKQTEPVNRKVALKLIKAGMDTRQVIARFEAERQALAMMDHPNIAKVLDAGATESGRPYFVMELVKGQPITQYCDEQQMDTESRLKLFQKVCQGVQHAHQKGIIHRDLKPSNVLVAMYDDQPVPKVIDFGVAKASGDELTEKTMFTRLGQIVGTLEYMSPEQAQLNNLDIDTRSDIYSLGAILYELLSGEPPFERERLKSQALDETLRMIREEEPTKPSTRLSSAKKTTQSATDRRTSPAKLGGILEGDLDWIVLKALAKDRLQRYETANGFASDIERFLTDEPVIAGPPSTVYHIRKFVRRNRVAIVTASLFAGLLIAGTVISAWQAIRATRAEQQAQVEKQNAINEAAISKAVNDFLNEDLLGSASPHGEPDRDLKVRELLDRVATTVETRFIDQPLVEAKIRVTLANAYKSLGEYKNADSNLQRARTLTEQERGTEHRDFLEMSLEILWVDHIWSEEYERICTQLEGVVQQCSGKFGNEDTLTLHARACLADLHRHLEQYETAEAQLSEIVESCQRNLGNSDQLTLDVQLRLADLYFDMRRYVDSEKISHQVLLERQESIGIEHPATLGSLSVLAKSIAAQGRFKEAAELYGRLIEFQTRVLGADHPVLLQNKTELGLALINHGQSQRAETILREVLNTYGTSVSSRHPYRLRAMNLLSYALLNQDKIEESLELENEIVEVKTVTSGAEHPDTLNSLQNIATNLLALGRFQESENRFREVLEVRRRVQSPEHPFAITAMEGIGLCLMGLGHYDESESFLRDGYTASKRVLGVAAFPTINSAGQLGEVLLKKENYADAEQVVGEAIAAAEETVDSENNFLLYCERVLATAECLQGKYDQSESRVRRVLETRQKTSGNRNRETLYAAHVLGMTLEGNSRYSDAESELQRVWKGRRQVLGDEHPDTLETMHRLASVIAKQGRYDDAVKLRREVVELRLKVLGEQHPDTVNSRLALAGDLLNLDSPQESEVLCREILKSNKNVLGQQKHAIIQCHKTLADALRQQGRTEEAAKVQEELALLQND